MVYRARDTVVGRLVALKILKHKGGALDRNLRFLQEAKAASALNHLNIVIIYEIGGNAGIWITTSACWPRGLESATICRRSRAERGGLGRAVDSSLLERPARPGAPCPC